MDYVPQMSYLYKVDERRTGRCVTRSLPALNVCPRVISAHVCFCPHRESPSCLSVYRRRDISRRVDAVGASASASASKVCEGSSPRSLHFFCTQRPVLREQHLDRIARLSREDKHIANGAASLQAARGSRPSCVLVKGVNRSPVLPGASSSQALGLNDNSPAKVRTARPEL